MFFEKFFSFIYPNICGLCGKSVKYNSYTCTNCLSILKYYRGREINNCKTQYYDQMINLYEYTGIIKKRIWQLKFRDGKYISKAFAYLIYMKLRKLNIGFDIIIPVPISMGRYMERGYNQCGLLVKELSKLLKKESSFKLLIKRKNNKRQSDLNIIDRKINVVDVYKIKDEEKIKNKIILLVDDVCTTGSTLNECAKMLKLSGAKKVIAITIAYA